MWSSSIHMSNFQSDDGSQQFFDTLLEQRMHVAKAHQQRRSPAPQQHQQRGRPYDPYLDRRVTAPAQHQQQTISEVHDPYAKSVIEKYQSQPHYGPAHAGLSTNREVASNYEVEVDMAAMQRQILQRQMEMQRSNGNVGMSVDEELAKLPTHLRAQFASLAGGEIPAFMQPQRQQQQFLPGQQQQPQYQHAQQQMAQGHVTLMEGHPVYRAIEANGFGGTVILAREIGVVNANIAQVPMVLGSQAAVGVYVIPQHQTTVNLQEIQSNPSMLKRLVIVRPPPMAGIGTSLLVMPESIRASGVNGGRQVITDARQRMVPQHYNNQTPPGARTILRG